MEGWHCEECVDGWLRPREDATCSRTEHMLKYGKDLLSLQEQYQDKDDLALCHLKYGLAQAYKLAGDQESCLWTSVWAELEDLCAHLAHVLTNLFFVVFFCLRMVFDVGYAECLPSLFPSFYGQNSELVIFPDWDTDCSSRFVLFLHCCFCRSPLSEVSVAELWTKYCWTRISCLPVRYFTPLRYRLSHLFLSCTGLMTTMQLKIRGLINGSVYNLWIPE
ncbi:hypothetical protein TELCIR_20305 [Teladorsagia circumcincta]|uniref:Uncharacterized protein n=1 Tax=Teladorsagia circumcincta TaxID=45464 RepID=A0A2G9TJV3_TELCI|nr:hypothetical protein TELCIR_20305 [Teladorsagia circumcincta]